MSSRLELRLALGTGALAAALSVSATMASAQSTAPTSIMKACWVEGSGVLYRRDTTGAPTGCQQSTHRAIEWTLGLVPTSTGGLTAVPVPLSLFGTEAGPILNLQNAGNGQAIFATAVGTTAVAQFSRSTGTGFGLRVGNQATGDGVGTAISAAGAGNQSTVDIVNTGAGQALVARNNSSVQAALVALNSATSGSGAIYADSKGTGPAADFRNSGSANGAAMNARASGNNTAATIYSDGAAGANALYAESKGQWTTADFRNTGTANGGALLARSSTATVSTASIFNDGAGTGNAVYAESKGSAPTIVGNNTGTNGAGVQGLSNSQVFTGDFRNTGNGGGVYTTSQGSEPTIIAQNASTTNGYSLRAISFGSIATGEFRNQGTTGGALVTESNSNAVTLVARNLSTTGGIALRAVSSGPNASAEVRNQGSGGALFLESNSASAFATLNIDAKNGATALYAKSSNQNGVWFDNVGTGQNIAILGTSSGVWPTAQFENRAGGIALRTVGNAIIAGNLTIEGNYVATGTKNAVVPTSSGTREMYTEEATEVWFADYGQATLSDSVVWVPFDGTFAETIEADRPYHVFLQAYADASIFVSRRTSEGFEVRITGARPTAQPIEFSYRLVAKRRGYGDRRLRSHALPRVDGVASGSASGIKK